MKCWDSHIQLFIFSFRSLFTIFVSGDFDYFYYDYEWFILERIIFCHFFFLSFSLLNLIFMIYILRPLEIAFDIHNIWIYLLIFNVFSVASYFAHHMHLNKCRFQATYVGITGVYNEVFFLFIISHFFFLSPSVFLSIIQAFFLIFFCSNDSRVIYEMVNRNVDFIFIYHEK